MQPQAEQLVVRQHERFHCRLACQLRVADEAAEQVVMARTVGDGTGAIEAFVTDTSRGGLGIESPVFFPRGCRIKVRIKPSASGQAPEKDMIVRVQRVSMLDRRPTYYLGLSFASKGPDHEAAVAVLLEMARQSQAATQGPGAKSAVSASLAAPGLGHQPAPHSLPTPPLTPPQGPSSASGKGGH